MNKDKVICALLALVSFLIFWISKDFSLFWDTIQFAGKHPLFYYENSFSSFFLPSEIDSGHFPLFGMYLATVWIIFGKSLMVSHMAMMPFVFMSLYLSFRLGRYWLNDTKHALFFPLLLLCIPQCASQLILVSPDVVLMCCFFGILVSLNQKNHPGILISSIGLALISNRGVLILLAIIIWDFIKHRNSKTPSGLTKYIIPAVSITSIFHLTHLIHSGWIGFHSDMPWSDSFTLGSLEQIIRNQIIYLWRLIDFGMISIWVGLTYLLYKKGRSVWNNSYVILLIVLLVIFEITVIPFSGLMQHRYFLPIYTISGFVFLIFILNSDLTQTFKMNILGIVFLILLSGNYWIYPNNIAQGWDSTLAHVPYYTLQSKMIDYLDIEKIEFKSVGTEFPLRSPHRELFLEDNTNQFSRKNLLLQDYILWSNVMNDFGGDEIDDLFSHWEKKVILEKRGVKMILFKKI